MKRESLIALPFILLSTSTISNDTSMQGNAKTIGTRHSHLEFCLYYSWVFWLPIISVIGGKQSHAKAMISLLVGIMVSRILKFHEELRLNLNLHIREVVSSNRIASTLFLTGHIH